MPERQEIETLILGSVKMLAQDFDLEALKQPSPESYLYGENGTLDSMALVNLIADIEDALAEQYDLSIALADEKAMSAKNSPYRSVSSLADAVMERLPS
jgi:acyl carrier protein